MHSKDPRQSLEAFLADNLPAIPVPENFVQQIQHRVRATPTLLAAPRPARLHWASAAAAALALIAILAGFETGQLLSTPSGALPIEQSMLLLNQSDQHHSNHPL